MRDLIISFLLGIIGAWIASSLPHFSWFTRFKDAFSDAFSSTPKVKEFERRLHAASFEKYPPEEARFSCYVRQLPKGEEAANQKQEKPVYHFFIEPDVRIDKFLAFLIPPLDRGHGRRGSAPDETVAYKWNYYLHEVDQRAPKTPAASSEHKARRIVFFDKSKLLLLIFHKEWVISAAQIEGKRFKPLERADDLTLSAREIIEYSYDIALIHQIIYKGESIECRYASKSEVPASEYYDFGLYEVEGTPIVYTPIHYKDTTKTLAKEKVFVGNTRAQELEIAGFVSDFNDLWKVAQAACSDQKSNHLPISERSLRNRYDDYYAKMHFLKPEFFEEIYCKEIRRILLAELGVDIPKIALFSSSGAHDPTKG